ncbi:MAG: hemoglobin [Saprospiraceae bacterium]|nr:hemoglobin [Saprospiraceae bacterium]
MNARQVILVQNSWRLFLSVDPVMIGQVFYGRLFMQAPRLKHLFHISTEDQSKKLVEMLNVIVGRLDRLSELTDDLNALALRHVKYGVKPEHYQTVGDALIWTLERGLGKDWNEDVKEAWTQCYNLLSATMINAAGHTRPVK